MRLSVALLIVALAGVLGGAALIGLPALGGAIIFDSLAVGWLALSREDGLPAPQARAPGSGGTLAEILERARNAS